MSDLNPFRPEKIKVNLKKLKPYSYLEPPKKEEFKKSISSHGRFIRHDMMMHDNLNSDPSYRMTGN